MIHREEHSYEYEIPFLLIEPPKVYTVGPLNTECGSLSQTLSCCHVAKLLALICCSKLNVT